MPTSRIHNQHNCFESSSDTENLNCNKFSTFGTISSLGTGPASIYRHESILGPEDLHNKFENWNYKHIDDWSPVDTIFWLISELNQLKVKNLAAVPVERFKQIWGSELKRLSVEELRVLIPQYGDQLYQQLQARIDCCSVEPGGWEVSRPLSPPLEHYSLTDLDQSLSLSLEHNLPHLTHAGDTQLHISKQTSNLSSRGDTQLHLSKQTSNLSSSSEIEENTRLQSKGSSSELDCGYNSETNSEIEKPVLKVKRKVGRPRCALKKGRSHYKIGRVWEFIRDLVMDTKYNPKVIRWVDRQEGIFRFENSEQVARLWGLKRGNRLMNFEKFSRSVRHNYKKEYLLPMKNQRLVYKFGPKSYGWK